MERCPKAIIDDESTKCVSWWSDWKTFKALPFGSESIHKEPAIVYDILTECENVMARIGKEQEEKWRKNTK